MIKPERPKYVYLINKQDRHCPENNNGDYIVAAFLSKTQAKKLADELDIEDPYDIHYVLERELEDEY